MQRLFAIFGLTVAVIITIAAYPYVQIDSGKILVTGGLIQFAAAGPTAKATGGIITTNGDYIVHTFTNIGTSTFEVTSGSLACSNLIVGGGGAGGDFNNVGGGGGGGGVLEVVATLTGVTNVVVGRGGPVGVVFGVPPSASGISSIGTNIAYGGGYGAANNYAGGDGGCGGGGSYRDASGTGTAGQGYDGGGQGSESSPYGCSGGGGSAEVGETTDVNTGGDGGNGISNNITGTYAWYGGGGGGACQSIGNAGSGGLGGGGDGADWDNTSGSKTAEPGEDGLGGGGGGNNTGTQQPGGSGRVVISYDGT